MFVDMSKFARVLIVVALAGCSTQVTPSGNPQISTPVFASGPAASTAQFEQASDVTLVLSEAARARLADNLKFDQNRLLDMVRRALDANNLLASSPDPNLPSIDITVTDVRVRSSFSAVMFGFMAGADRIVGDVVARAPGGEELQRFNVNVSYALGGLAGGQDSTRLDWLYESFATETAKALTGSDTATATAATATPAPTTSSTAPQSVSAPTASEGEAQTPQLATASAADNSALLSAWRTRTVTLRKHLTEDHRLVFLGDADIENIEIIGVERGGASEILATLMVKYDIETSLGANTLRLARLESEIGTYRRTVIVNVIEDRVVRVGAPNRLN